MKRFLIVVTFAIILTACVSVKFEAKTLNTPPEKSIEELYQDIFISLLSPEIEKAIDNYYSKKLTDLPMVYPYQVYIEKTERIGEYRSFEFLVTMKVQPVVGPHIQVGEDRLTFYIGGSGNVELKKFEHIRDYELPENWQHILK